MADNKIQVFAEQAASADMLTDAEYETNETRIFGNKVGIAKRQPVNKALHQATLMASALGEYIARNSSSGSADIGDNLTADKIADALDKSVQQQVQGEMNQGNAFVRTTGDETIEGIKTFVVLPESAPVPVKPVQLINKLYADTEIGKAKDELNKKIEDGDKVLSDRIDKVEQDQKDLNDKVTDLNTKVDDLKDKVTDIENNGGNGGGTAGTVLAPAIISPADGAADVAPDTGLVAGPFRSAFPDNTRTYREFQIAALGTVTTIAASGGGAAGTAAPDWAKAETIQVNADKTALKTALTQKSSYAWRCRDHSSYNIVSAWSDVAAFTVAEVPDSPVPDKPSVTAAPLYGGKAGSSITLTGSALSMKGSSEPSFSGPLTAAQWRITDAAGTVKEFTRTGASANVLNTADVPYPLEEGGVYKVQVRYTVNADPAAVKNYSGWSDELTVTALAKFYTVVAPALTMSGSTTAASTTPTINGSSFALTPAGATSPAQYHSSTTWVVTTAAGAKAYELVKSTASKTSLTIPSGVLSLSLTYKVKATYHSDAWGDATSPELSFTVQAMPTGTPDAPKYRIIDTRTGNEITGSDADLLTPFDVIEFEAPVGNPDKWFYSCGTSNISNQTVGLYTRFRGTGLGVHSNTLTRANVYFNAKCFYIKDDGSPSVISGERTLKKCDAWRDKGRSNYISEIYQDQTMLLFCIFGGIGKINLSNIFKNNRNLRFFKYQDELEYNKEYVFTDMTWIRACITDNNFTYKAPAPIFGGWKHDAWKTDTGDFIRHLIYLNPINIYYPNVSDAANKLYPGMGICSCCPNLESAFIAHSSLGSSLCSSVLNAGGGGGGGAVYKTGHEGDTTAQGSAGNGGSIIPLINRRNPIFSGMYSKATASTGGTGTVNSVGGGGGAFSCGQVGYGTLGGTTAGGGAGGAGLHGGGGGACIKDWNTCNGGDGGGCSLDSNKNPTIGGGGVVGNAGGKGGMPSFGDFAFCINLRAVNAYCYENYYFGESGETPFNNPSRNYIVNNRDHLFMISNGGGGGGGGGSFLGSGDAKIGGGGGGGAAFGTFCCCYMLFALQQSMYGSATATAYITKSVHQAAPGSYGVKKNGTPDSTGYAKGGYVDLAKAGDLTPDNLRQFLANVQGEDGKVFSSAEWIRAPGGQAGGCYSDMYCGSKNPLPRNSAVFLQTFPASASTSEITGKYPSCVAFIQPPQQNNIIIDNAPTTKQAYKNALIPYPVCIAGVYGSPVYYSESPTASFNVSAITGACTIVYPVQAGTANFTVANGNAGNSDNLISYTTFNTFKGTEQICLALQENILENVYTGYSNCTGNFTIGQQTSYQFCAHRNSPGISINTNASGGKIALGNSQFFYSYMFQGSPKINAGILELAKANTKWPNSAINWAHFCEGTAAMAEVYFTNANNAQPMQTDAYKYCAAAITSAGAKVRQNVFVS